MADDHIEVYRVERTLRIAGGDRVERGDLLFDPPAWAVERLDRHLERLDDDGRIPRETLRYMHYTKLQQLAAAGDVEEVNGNSTMEEIIDAYAQEDDDVDSE